jgi:hypothetical protein
VCEKYEFWVFLSHTYIYTIEGSAVYTVTYFRIVDNPPPPKMQLHSERGNVCDDLHLERSPSLDLDGGILLRAERTYTYRNSSNKRNSPI